MSSIVDDKGFNQGFKLVPSTIVRMKRRATWIGDLIKKENARVLEIGCGTGELSFWIAEKNPKLNVVATDICEPFIEYAKHHHKSSNLEYGLLDLNHFDALTLGKFDYIIGNGILHHVFYELDSVLDKFSALLNDDGKIIFMEPNIWNPYCFSIFRIPLFRRLAKLEPGEMAFSRKFIRRKLENHKFQHIKITFKDFLLPGIPFFLVKFSIYLGNILEKLFFTSFLAQSIFIEASKKS